jgi:hypothetical protein
MQSQVFTDALTLMGGIGFERTITKKQNLFIELNSDGGANLMTVQRATVLSTMFASLVAGVRF